jgi:acyl carrier protein
MINTFIKNNALRRQMAALVHTQTGIAPSRLLTLTFDQLGVDNRDLLDIILEVEKCYQVIIPDEVPLQSLDDFIRFIQTHRVSEDALALV